MSTLGQALGMAYANQYGAKYDLPIFGITREEDENPLSSLDLATKLSQPVGATPAEDTGVMPQRPIVQDKPFFDKAIDFVNPFVGSNTTNMWQYLNPFGAVRAGIDVAKGIERWATPQPGATPSGLQSIALPVAQFARNAMQAASPEQDLADIGNLIFKQVNEKIFNNPFPTPPKLDRYADAEGAGFSSPGQIGSAAGDLAGMIAMIASGTASVKAMELPALARTVSTIPGIGGAIAKVAPWLGAETLGGAVGAGLGNAAHSAGTDARSVLEGKEELGHMIAKTGLQGVAGTMFGGAATPGVSLSKKVLGEAAVNVLSGVIPAGYDAVTGRTTWLPQRTPTAEAVAKLNAAKASGDPDAIALAAGEADRTATHTLLGAMNSVAGQALLNGLAGAVLPLGAAGMKKLVGSARIVPKANPVETPTGAAPVSEAMAPGMAQQAAEDMEAIASFVKNNYRTRDDIANSGMGKNRTEIRQSIIAQANENPAIFQVVKDINAGKATPNDFYAAIKREAPTQAPKPVAQEVIPPPTKEQMEHDSLNNLYVVHKYPSKEAVPENMRQYVTATGEGQRFSRFGKKIDDPSLTFAKVRVPQSQWEYLTQQRIERPTTAVPNIPVSEDFAGQNPVIETMPLDKKAQPAEVVVPPQQSTTTPNMGRVAVEMPTELQVREIPAMKQIPADLTPEAIGRMSEEELAQHFDIAPPAERVPDVGETIAAEPMPAPEPAPVAQAAVGPAAMKSEYEELMAGNRQTKTKDGVTYTRRAPFVKTEGETLVPTRPDVIVGNPTSVQFLESVVPGHYVFHPAGLSVPSHVNGKVNESYFLENPQGKSGQKGIDYVGDRIKYGSFDPKQMVGKDANAYMSAPKVILPTGEPIQGNTRAEFEQKIYQPENARQAEQYKNEILANAEYYGLDTPEKLAAFKAMKNPTISRVVDVDDVTAQRLAMRHQDEAAWSKSPTDNSILRLSTMEPETEKKALRMIAAGLEGEEGEGKTLLQLLRKEDYRKDIALLLAGPKDQKKYAAYMDNMDNNLGANAIQDDLRNLVFGKDERTIRKFDGLTNKQKDVINSNLGALLRLHDDPLFKDFKSAVDGLQAYNAAAQKQGKGLQNWLKGSNAFGRAHSEDYSEAAQKLMLLMDENPPADVRKMLTEYLEIRKNTSGESMFGEEPIPYSTMFQRAIDKTGEGRLLGLAAPIVGQAAGEAGASFFEDDKEYVGIKGSTIKNALRTLGLAAGMIATVHAMGGGKMLKIITKRGEEVTVKPLPEGTKIINGFYSPIEKMLRETKQEKNSAAKWLSMIGKGDEAKYTGLRAKLEAMKPNEQVSKADLLAHLDENRIVPVEVVKSFHQKEGRTLKDWEYRVEPEGGRNIGYYLSPDGEYTIKRDGYEVVVTRLSDQKVIGSGYNSEEALYNSSLYQTSTTHYDKYQSEDKFGGAPKNYKEVLITLPGKGEVERVYSFDDAGHWREKDVLVHTRYNTRAVKGGKTALLIEEIQSDWGQKIRDEGFEIPPGKEYSIRKENRGWAVIDENGIRRGNNVTLDDAQVMAAKFKREGITLSKEAPFVAKTADTTKLALKYILRDAIRKDADYIVWASGDMQTERFSLRNTVETVKYYPETQLLKGFNKHGGREIDYEDVYPGDLPKMIGKEQARRILDKELTGQGESAHWLMKSGYKQLQGAELESSGGGMNAFYGNASTGNIGTLGEVIESIVGKGAVKTFGGLHGIEMTPAIRAQAQAGLSLFNIGGALIVPDNDEPIYPGASITNREVRILLGGAAIASLATHPQITGLLRNLKISAESMFGEEPIPYSTMFQRAIDKTGEGRLLGLAAPIVGQAAGEAGASFFEDDKEYVGIKGSTIKNALRTLGLAAGMIATVHAMGGGKMLKIITKRGEEVTVKPLPEGTKIINGFYSPIEKMLRETKQEKNSAAKWLSMIGKGDEAKYTGLRAKLEAMKPNEQVPKAALLAHLDENRIVPVEVVKGELEVKGKVKHIIPDKWVEVKGVEGTLESADGRYVIDFEPELAEQGIPPYTLFDNVSNRSARSRFYTVEEAKRGMHELPTDVYKHKTRDGGSAKWDGRSFNVDGKFGGWPQQYKERLVILPGEKKFKSMHWEEPNVLVHTRSSIRNAIGGKKVLLVEEIQSDWGQSGRDKWWAADGGDGTQEAPFVTETAATTKLAAKYLLQDAVESNVDYVTWTSGNIQNERNALTKVADTIVYDKINNKLGRLITYKDGYVQYKAYLSSDKELEAHIGKELSAKLLAQPSKDHRIDDMSNQFGEYAHIKHRLYENAQVLSGAEMEVGGGPMKAFYGEPATGNIGMVGQVIESIVGKGAVKTFGGLHGIEMTPAIRAQAQAGLSLFNIGGALIVPDNDEPIYPGASITNREVRILLGGAAIASLATHPQITGLLRNLKISAPETALRELTKVEPVIPGYVDKKLNPTKFTDADVSALVGKAKADGITDELLAHHLAFTRGEQYSRQHLEESRANLYGNQIDPEAEQAAADYLLKSLTHAHNGNMELPEMSDRLHTIALNTIDGAEGVVGKNEYVQSNAAIKNPAAAHTATITQGREQTLGVPDEDYATVAKSVLDLDDLNQKGSWSDDLYFAATGRDETLQSALTKMDKREQLSPEEVQAWQKYEAEKSVWNDAIAKGTNDNDWSGIEAIRTKFRDPIRADAFDRYVSTKAWETQMDNEVNAIAKENGFDPIPPPRVKSQALYSSVFPIVPGTWAAVKKSRLGQVALSSAFGYVASNAIFEDDKMYGGMTGKEAKLLMTATFGGLVGAAHIGSYFFTKHAPIWARTAINNAMHPVDTVALHDVENVAAKKYGRGTEKFNQAVTDLQAKLKRIDKGVRKTKHTTSAPWLAAIEHEEFAKIETAQIKAQNTGRLQKREIDLLHDKYKAFSSADKQIVNAAAAAYDWELGLIRANKNLDAVGKDEAVKRVQAALEATWFKDRPTAKQAFDLYHEMAKHARQIDVESRLMKKFGLKWDQLPEKIAASRTLVEVQKDKVRELQQLYAMAEDPASKTAIRKDIHTNNKLRENHQTFAEQLEYMRDLPAESQKYHYLPHYWDKNGRFKYAIKDEAGNMVEYRKFDTKADAEKFIKQFRSDAAAGLHKNTAARVATENFVKGKRDIRLTINDLVSAAYSEKTATLARLGLNREALFKALETLDEWTDLPLESRIKVYETLEDNITPESLRHILNEMWAPKDVHLEFRQMRKGYLDVDPKKQLDGTISKQEQRQLHDWVFGGLDKMITGGRLTLEKSAMLHEASNQLDQLGKEGLSSSRYYSWLKDEFIPSLTNQDPIPASRARKIGNVRSAMSMAKLVANPLHGASNIIYGSLATFAEAGIAHKGNVAKAAWYMMTSALDLPTGGKYSSPEMQKGIKLLEKHDYGETQFYNQALRSELGNNELVRKMMFSSVKSEEFNNKMSSIVFMKTALNKGATVEEAVEYALKMRQRTQFAFTPWMTTGVERYIRKSFGGAGSVMLTLMGAAIRGAEHTLSIYSRAAANPKTAFVPAMAMLTAATMISGLYGDPWVATGMRTIELADELLADDDDTRLTNESFLEKCQRRVGDVAEKYGLPREKGENLWNTILQGVPARTTNINMSLDNNLSGMLSPVALSTATQIIKAGGAIISDQSWQEKMLNITKPVTVLARTARAGLSLAEGHRVDNKGNPTTDKPYGMADAFKEITTGTPADVAFAQRAKAAGGGDLQDQFSKEGYVKSMYNMPMLKVGNEKNPEQRQILTEKAPVIRRVIQSNYEKSSDARSKDLEDAIAWARANKPFMNWIDRNGGADILGNVAQKAAPALARNIENWYAAQAAADAVNTTVGPIAKFSPKKLAVEDAITRLQKTAEEKANTPEKKAELRKLFIGLQQVKK